MHMTRRQKRGLLGRKEEVSHGATENRVRKGNKGEESITQCIKDALTKKHFLIFQPKRNLNTISIASSTINPLGRRFFSKSTQRQAL